MFSIYSVNTLQAIVVNYIVACICGIIAYNTSINFIELPSKNWFWGAMALGLLFIIIFNLIALTTQKNGISVAAVATKMSLVIPSILGIYIYNESLNSFKIIGILIALLAVYLVSTKGKENITKNNLLLPILVFIGSGIIDASIKFIETTYVAENEIPLFSALIFGFAAIIGMLLISYEFITSKMKLELKSVLAGIVLGIPNYFSIYFLIKALRYNNIDSATIFTINNVAILLCTSVLGILFFKEKMSPKNWIGILLAITSIILVSISI